MLPPSSNRSAPARLLASSPPAAEQWNKQLTQLPCDSAGLVPLASFLPAPQVKEPSGHCILWLDGSRKAKPWKSHTGHKPVEGRDWDCKKKLNGRRGWLDFGR